MEDLRLYFKFLLPYFLIPFPGNAQDIDMVFREVEMLKSLNHKNIVKILNCYTLPNMEVIIVMEFLEGGELLDYVLEKGRLDESESRFFFKQVVDAVFYIHQQKLIHRDLKLENLLLAAKNDKIIKVQLGDRQRDFPLLYRSWTLG